MKVLRAEYLRAVPCAEGPQAEVALIEPNGDRCVVRCLVAPAKLEIGSLDPVMMDHLHEVYGRQYVGEVAAAEVVRHLREG